MNHPLLVVAFENELGHTNFEDMDHSLLTFSFRASCSSLPAQPGKVRAGSAVGRVGVEALPGLGGHCCVGGGGFDGPDMFRHEPVEALAGIHQPAVPGWQDMKVQAIQGRGVEFKSALGRPFHHPGQGDVRKARVPVAAANVRVHAREPDLLQALATDSVLFSPHTGLEGLAALVDGQGLKGVVHAAAQVHVVEFDIKELVDDVEVPGRNAQRPHRVPDADTMHADLARIRAPEEFGLDGPWMRLFVAAAVEAVGIVKLWQVARAQEARVAQQSAQAAHRVGPATEAEQKDVVAVLVLLHEKTVGLQNVPRYPRAGNPATDLVEPLRAHAGIVIEQLTPAVPGKGGHAHGQPGHVGRRNHPFILLVRSVPGAVAADDDAFGHVASLAARPKMAICCVREKIQTAYVCQNTLRALDFFASLHLTIFEQAANFEFLNSQLGFGRNRARLRITLPCMRPGCEGQSPVFFLDVYGIHEGLDMRLPHEFSWIRSDEKYVP